jgi:hypothetical protein
VTYASTSTNVTTGPELPTSPTALNDLTITSTQGVTLGADVTVNGVCTTSSSDLITDAYTVTLGPAATLVESDSITVVGTVTTTRTVSQSVNETFGNIGLEVNAAGAAPGVTQVTRVTGTAKSINGSEGIERYFDVSPALNAGLDAAIVCHYDHSELNGITEDTLEVYESFDGGSTWSDLGGTVDEMANTVTTAGIDSLATLTLGREGIISGVEDDIAGTPDATRLVSIYPNPFNPTTKIVFELKERGPVHIEIYDVSGRKVHTLVHDTMDAGRYGLTWNGVNDAGKAVASGVYLCRMMAGRVSQTEKMVLLR